MLLLFSEFSMIFKAVGNPVIVGWPAGHFFFSEVFPRQILQENFAVVQKRKSVISEMELKFLNKPLF